MPVSSASSPELAAGLIATTILARLGLPFVATRQLGLDMRLMMGEAWFSGTSSTLGGSNERLDRERPRRRHRDHVADHGCQRGTLRPGSTHNCFNIPATINFSSVPEISKQVVSEEKAGQKLKQPTLEPPP